MTTRGTEMTQETPREADLRSLDEEWARAVEVLPTGWCLSLTAYPPGQWDAHATAWNFNGGVSAGVVDGFGPTPAAALAALREALGETER